MLPSFRLIAATFLCGFAVIFASLRLAASLNELHESIPVTASRAAPSEMLPPVDADMRRSAAAVPLMYDLRFAVTAASLVPMPASLAMPAVNRTAPTALPPAVVQPAIDLAVLTPAAAETGFAGHSEIVAATQPMAPDEAQTFERPATIAQSVIEPLTAVAPAGPPQLEMPADVAHAQVASPAGTGMVESAVPGPEADETPEPEVAATVIKPATANPVVIKSVELQAAPAPQSEIESRATAERPAAPGPQATPTRVAALEPHPAPAAKMIAPATAKLVQTAAFEPSATPESDPKPVRFSPELPAAALVPVPLPRARPAPRAKAKAAASYATAKPARLLPGAKSLGPQSVATRPGSRAKPAATHTARAARPPTASTGLFPFGDLQPPPPLPNLFGLP
jgi:hypothetical protein